MFLEDKKYIELINDIGDFIEYWGFRSIHGRIWACVYLSATPLSTPEIVKGLEVSKALVSGAINELLEHKLITAVGQVKYGGITYSACENPAQVVRDVIKKRELVLFEKIDKNLSDLNRQKISYLKDQGVDIKALKELKYLTLNHKIFAQKIVTKKIETMSEWIGFVKKSIRFGL